MNNAALITRFYESFSRCDAEGMVDCYHREIRFEDPAFGVLNGEEAKDMWRMLIARSKETIRIQFRNIQADEEQGTAEWTATYIFSRTGRKVVNRVSARFAFCDGKIISHTDHFNMWKWSAQALGWKGYLLGWSAIMKKKIQTQSNALLKKYRKEKL
jgi:ketosteroid isomerase-like protein